MILVTRTMSCAMKVMRFSTLPENSGDGCCLLCHTYLDLHQPDCESPDRLLGICDQCGSWYLVHILPDADEAIMVLLPGGDDLWTAQSVEPA